MQTNWGKDVCIKTAFTFFEVLAAKEVTLASAYSGILGIAPDDEKNGPSFIAKLVEDKIIDSKMVSVLLQRKPLSSYITFGGKSDFMMNKVNGSTPINWYKSTNKTSWKLKLRDTLVRKPNETWGF